MEPRMTDIFAAAPQISSFIGMASYGVQITKVSDTVTKYVPYFTGVYDMFPI
jgi:hypothetical protein